MVKVKEDMTGWKMWEHGVPESRLIVKRRIDDYISPGGTSQAMWLCQCSCGSDKEVRASGSAIRSGHTMSCGCLQSEKTAESNKTRCKNNRYDLTGDYGVGWTSNTNKEFYFDIEDYDAIKDYLWYEDVRQSYHRLRAKAKNDGRYVAFHQALGLKYYDHIDRNPLNNRRCNLRPATMQENSQNRSPTNRNTTGVVGVVWNKEVQKWRVTIGVDNRVVHVGYFINKEDAIRARLEAEAKCCGEFAPQRHLFEQYGICNEPTNNSENILTKQRKCDIICTKQTD